VSDELARLLENEIDLETDLRDLVNEIHDRAIRLAETVRLLTETRREIARRDAGPDADA
jgi:hypothetical protein